MCNGIFTGLSTTGYEDKVGRKKDQLCGLLKVVCPYSKEELEAPIIELSGRSSLKVSFIRDYLRSFFSSQDQRQSELPSGRRLRKYSILTENREVAHAVA